MDLPKIAGKAPIPFEAEKEKGYYWCSCGLSENQPFCDGKHKGSEMNPLACKETKDKKVFLCTCKQTKNPPYCDGAHKEL